MPSTDAQIKYRFSRPNGWQEHGCLPSKKERDEKSENALATRDAVRSDLIAEFDVPVPKRASRHQLAILADKLCAQADPTTMNPTTMNPTVALEYENDENWRLEEERLIDEADRAAADEAYYGPDRTREQLLEEADELGIPVCGSNSEYGSLVSKWDIGLFETARNRREAYYDIDPADHAWNDYSELPDSGFHITSRP